MNIDLSEHGIFYILSDNYFIEMYNQYHNKIYDKLSNGYESKREYDSDNNIIHYINNDKFEQWWEYDNKLIHFINTAGFRRMA